MTLQQPNDKEHQIHPKLLGPFYDYRDEKATYVEDLRPRFASFEVFEKARTLQGSLNVEIDVVEVGEVRAVLDIALEQLNTEAKREGLFEHVAYVKGEGISVPELRVDIYGGTFGLIPMEKEEQEAFLIENFMDSHYVEGRFGGFSLRFERKNKDEDADGSVGDDIEYDGMLFGFSDHDDEHDAEETEPEKFMPRIVYQIALDSDTYSPYFDGEIFIVANVGEAHIGFVEDDRLDSIPSSFELLLSSENKTINSLVNRLNVMLNNKKYDITEVAKLADRIANHDIFLGNVQAQDAIIELITHYMPIDQLYAISFDTFSLVDAAMVEQYFNKSDGGGTTSNYFTPLIFRESFTKEGNTVTVHDEQTLCLVFAKNDTTSYIPVKSIKKFKALS